jgi:hypothetical protein
LYCIRLATKFGLGQRMNQRWPGVDLLLLERVAVTRPR